MVQRISPLAMSDLRANVFAVFIVFAGGVYLVARYSRNAGKRTSPLWVLLLAVIAGPVVSVAWWSVDVFLLAPDSYVLTTDALAMLPPVLLIGTSVGLVVGIAFAIACRSGDARGKPAKSNQRVRHVV